MSRSIAPLLLILALASCKPPSDWEQKSGKQEEKAPRGPALDDITLEKRDDGLFYQVGADKPYTGTDIELDQKKIREEGRVGFTVVTPYKDGRINGTKQVYYPKGTLQEERVYENGAAKQSTVYFADGKTKKIFATLNAKDVAEGIYQRWYENGVLHTEGAHDADERFHGTFKEYAPDGQMKAHYEWVHGKLANILFETPGQKKERLEKYGEFEYEPENEPEP
jgi:antitoxin component YwqK of YwqJK toxin-antitoxin module